METTVVNLQRKVSIDTANFRSFSESLFRSIEEVGGRSAAVAFISDRRMKELNKLFRGKDSTTDVLSFPHEPDEFDPEGEPVAIPITDVIDLHTVPPRDVKNVVEAWLDEVHARGFTAIRIIHGRGVGVQREIVRKLLQRTPFVLTFQDAPAGWGGWGATIAVLALPGESNP